MRRFLVLMASAALALAPSLALAGPVTQPTVGSATPYTPASPAYATNFWYPSTPANTQAGLVGTAGTVYLTPYVPAQSITIDQVGVHITVPGGAGAQAAIYIYGANTAGNRPSGNPLAQCTITSVTASGVQGCFFPSPLALTGNRVYWIGWEINASATALVATAASGAAAYDLWLEGTLNSASMGGASSRLLLQFGNGAHGFGVASNPTTYSPAMSETWGIAKVPLYLLHVVSVP